MDRGRTPGRHELVDNSACDIQLKQSLFNDKQRNCGWMYILCFTKTFSSIFLQLILLPHELFDLSPIHTSPQVPCRNNVLPRYKIRGSIQHLSQPRSRLSSSPIGYARWRCAKSSNGNTAGWKRYAGSANDGNCIRYR